MTQQSQAVPPIIDLRKYIDTVFFGERPHIRGRRVLVSFVATAAEENDLTIAELAYEFTLSEEEVLAALLYYRENRDIIDAQDVEETRLFELTRKQHGKD